MPFFFFLSRYHISIQPTSTTTAITTTTTSLPPLPLSLHFHPYFHSIPSSPRFESGMRSPVQKGRFKEVLIGHGNAIPHSLSHVPRTSHHKRNFPLIVLSFPLAPLSFVFLVLFLSRRLSRSFVLVPTKASSFASHARPDT